MANWVMFRNAGGTGGKCLESPDDDPQRVIAPLLKAMTPERAAETEWIVAEGDSTRAPPDWPEGLAGDRYDKAKDHKPEDEHSADDSVARVLPGRYAALRERAHGPG